MYYKSSMNTVLFVNATIGISENLFPVCIVVNREKFLSPLELDPTMPIIELVQDIFIYYKVLEFYVPRSITI